MVKENVIKMNLIDRNPKSSRSRSVRGLGAVAGLVCLLLSLGAASALAAPAWTIESTHGPQNFAPGGEGQYVLQPFNSGDTITDGSVIRVTDTLPAGVTATAASGPGWTCVGVGTGVVDCERSDAVPPATDPDPSLSRGTVPVIRITVAIAPGASGTVDNVVTISGGGAPVSASDTDPTPFSATPAGFGIVPGSFLADVFGSADPGAGVERQAGSHPSEMRVRFDLNQMLTTNSNGTFTEPVAHPHMIRTKLPPGFIGNPEATPKCTSEQLTASIAGFAGACAVASQVGSVDIVLQNGPMLVDDDETTTQDLPVFNMIPPRGAVAAFAFVVVTRPVWIVATLDPTDYSVVTTINYASEALYVRSADLTLWGVPTDASHDGMRFDPYAVIGGTYGASVSTNVPRRPFLTLPSNCEQTGSVEMAMDSWSNPGQFITARGDPMTVTGCDKQAFAASLTAQPTNTTPSTPTGLAVTMRVRQSMDATGLGTPPLRDAVVTLPAGMSISPSAADGLLSCSSAQIGLGSNDAPTCPDASKIGTVNVVTPLLAEPLTGHVYQAAQTDNPFGSTLAIYIVAQGQGVLIKLAGKVAADPVTGQLTTTFTDNPQMPFSEFELRFKGGARAPLVTPPTCGVKTTGATLTSWNAALPAVQAATSFTIDGDCTKGFDPGFTAGTQNPTAGKSSPLVTRITRIDDDEELSTIDVSMPEGLLGRVADVVLCADAAANAGTCGDGSRIGTAKVGAGPGSNPFFITDGRVHMTGPYKGAPFGLSIVVHAKAGPLDLGNVVVRAAVHVDKHTAALRVVSDPMPTILEGIPLLVRVVDITVDRPGFTLNPTNCSAMSASATIGSTGGKSSTKSSRFQVGDCAALPFAPRMQIRVGGRGRTQRGRTTPLEATVKMTPGQANLRSVKVTLPATINARLNVINDACTRAEFEAGRCADAKAGTAVAVTPLLRDPLRGDAFFVRNGNPLPDLMVALRGQVDFDLAGKITIPRSKFLSTNFDMVPDVPVTKFTLRLATGRRGSVGNAANLCTRRSRRARAELAFTAQSGKVVYTSQRLGISGCRARRGRRARQNRAR